MIWPFNKAVNGYHRDKNSAQNDKTSIGNVLLDLGLVTTEQLSKALNIQEAQSPELGTILIDLGAIDKTQLEFALLKQKELRGDASTREVIRLHRLERRSLIKSVTNEMDALTKLSSDYADKMAKT